MSVYTDLLGQASSEFKDQVSRQKIEAFLKAIGHGGSNSEVPLIAPPTFATTCRKGEFELFTKLGIPLARVLHAEQEYHYKTEIREGDELRYQTKLGHCAEKKAPSGALTFLRFDTPVRIVREGVEQVAVESRTTIVVRG